MELEKWINAGILRHGLTCNSSGPGNVEICQQGSVLTPTVPVFRTE